MEFLKNSFSRVRKPRAFEYTPRYYDPVKEAREERQAGRIKLEKGSFYRHSKTLSSLREPSISHSEYRYSKHAKYARMLILMVMMVTVYFFFKNYWISIPLFLIELIVFLRINNRLR